MNAMDRVPTRNLIAAACLFLIASLGRAEPSDGPIVSEVIPVGNRLTPNQQIIGQLKTRPGLTFSPANAQEDVQTLRGAGFGDVRVRTQTASDGRLIVYFDVAEMPNKIGEIVFKGVKQ